jgi:preprotein translocase subunit SecE
LADKNNAKNEVVKVDKEKEKKLNEKNSKRAEAAKAPSRSPLKWFREARAEFKKVTWPTPKQVINNTSIVLVVLTIAGISIWGLDLLMTGLFNLALFGTWGG